MTFTFLPWPEETTFNRWLLSCACKRFSCQCSIFDSLCVAWSNIASILNKIETSDDVMDSPWEQRMKTNSKSNSALFSIVNWFALPIPIVRHPVSQWCVLPHPWLSGTTVGNPPHPIIIPISTSNLWYKTLVMIKPSGLGIVDSVCMGASRSTLTELRQEEVCPETPEQVASPFSFPSLVLILSLKCTSWFD